VTAEVAYTGLSNRWVFPDLWYTFTKTTSDGATVQVRLFLKNLNNPGVLCVVFHLLPPYVLQFVMIDTVVLSGNSDLPDGTQLMGSELPGPMDAKLAATQWQWVCCPCSPVPFPILSLALSVFTQIQATLAASKADYLVVAGHYPVWSVCEHGPTTLLVSQLKPLLEKYKVGSFMAVFMDVA
jgi:tartrate-resistant acid phosphatase type 5